MANPVAKALRWSAVPLQPTNEVVGMLLRRGLDGPPPHAWIGGAQDARVIEGLPETATDALEQPVGGLAILIDTATPPTDEPEHDGGKLAWYDLRDGRTTSVEMARRTGPGTRREISGHLEGPQIAVVDTWLHQPSTPGRPWEDARVEVSIVTPEAGARRTLLNGQAVLWDDPDTEVVQWSPDGSRLAVSFLAVDAVSGWYPVLRVLRATDGEVLGEWPRTALVGSASWTSDSRSLLVETDPLTPELRATVVLDITEDRRRTSGVPPRPTDDAKPVRPLALAGDDRVLLLTETLGADSVLTASTLDGRHVEEVLRWRAQGPSRPRIPTLAPATWDEILAAQRGVNAAV